MAKNPVIQSQKLRVHRPKSIDLGSLQDAYLKAKATLASDSKANVRAQETLDRSKQVFQQAYDELKAAAHTVLN